MTWSLRGTLRFLQGHRWQVLVLFFGVLIPLLVFGALAEDVWHREGFGWDVPLLKAIHAHANHALDVFVVRFTYLGGVYFLGPMSVLIFTLLARQKRWPQAAFLVLAVLGAAVLNVTAKAIFHRDRPDLWPRLVVEDTFSFPSGHAMDSVAFAAAVAVLAWPTRWRWPVLVLGVLFVLGVGLSRLYLGVHFPSDVLAGWCASLIWVTGLALILSGRLRPSKVER